jgi:formylglycine-generating enzyme required for sulfatase activity
MDLLAKEPANRPSSAQAVVDALDEIARPASTGLAATRSTGRRRSPVLPGIAASVLLTGLAILWAGGAFRSSTKDGTIVLEDLPANAEVLVDVATAKLKSGPDGKWIEVQVTPGERKLRIKAPGFVAETRDVTLSTGERKPIRIRLEPLATENLEVTNKSTTADDFWNRLPHSAPRPAIAPFDRESARKYQQAWAKFLDVPEEFTNSIGIRFRLIPPGEFTIGSTEAEIQAAKSRVSGQFDAARQERVLSEGPQRRVVLTKPSYLGVHEVTQRQYQRIAGNNPSIRSANGERRDRVSGMDTSEMPVENVTWSQATRYCNLLSGTEHLPAAYRITAMSTFASEGAGYRLPTEAEWEFACRPGTATLFWSGDDEASLLESAWYGGNNSSQIPKAAGTRAANPFGLYDVHGNVWEWVHDGWDPVFYRKLVGPAARDPRSETTFEGRRVIRGGDYFMSAAECRSASRDGCPEGTRWDDVGCRLALSVEAVRKPRAGEPGNSVEP